MYTRLLTTTVLILGVAAIAPAPASAQEACGTREAVVAKLSEKYGEVRRGGGLSSPTEVFEIWASATTGSWTILKTTPNGLSCIMAVGNGWQDDAGDLTTAGSPA
jgi:hypothetical protein